MNDKQIVFLTPEQLEFAEGKAKQQNCTLRQIIQACVNVALRKFEGGHLAIQETEVVKAFEDAETLQLLVQDRTRNAPGNIHIEYPEVVFTKQQLERIEGIRQKYHEDNQIPSKS